MMALQFNSFNARGLSDGAKRRTIFNWIKKNHKGVTLLQETHSTPAVEKQWQREWGSDMLFSHGSSKSKGVAILLPKSLKIEINKTTLDNDGRLIMTDINIEDQNFILVNLYAPTKDKQNEQLQLLLDLQLMLAEFQDRNIVIGGDFNTCMNPFYDKSGGTNDNISNYSECLIEFMTEYNLMDIWRSLNPESRQFTWRGMTRAGLVQSRLDLFLTSAHMIYDVDFAEIRPGIRSDHNIINVKFLINEVQQRGPGFWKFNVSLLKDAQYVDKIKNLIAECKIKYANFENKPLLWDIIKCEIRSETISHASWCSKQRKKLENELNREIEKLEKDLNNGKDIYREHQDAKSKLEKLLQSNANGVFIRSRAQFIEENEKCTSYFCQLEKRNYKTKTIKCIKTENKTLTNQAEILEEQFNFYRNLYTKANLEVCEGTCKLLNDNIPKLSNNDKNLCELAITLDECSRALKELANNKTPGSDGLTAEFYKFFWVDINSFVFESFIYSFEHNELSVDQRRSILTLLPKAEKDLRFLKNWRPLSLLNTDYKILTKLLSIRLQLVIHKLVSEDQVAYIKNRQIGENCRKIIDAFEFTSGKVDQGVALFLDFEKAFDTVSREFLQNTLNAFNFGEHFKKWISVIYNKPLTTVVNNGFSSKSFESTRGIRQGCPISALLFILVAEVMAVSIRQDNNVNGLCINDCKLTITQMADDTSLFVKDLASVQNCLNTLDHFYKCAGLKLNKDKTEAILLGKKTLKVNDKMGLNWVKGPIKVTGIWVGHNIAELSQNSINEKIQKIKTLLNLWKSRNLSIKGKITILRTQAMPIILYLASVLSISNESIEIIDKLFFDFIWPNGKHHVKKKVLIQEIEDGGLKMPDIESMIKSIKLTWVKKILLKTNTFTDIAKSVSGIKQFAEHLRFKNDARYLSPSVPGFYKQLLLYWYEIHSRPPDTPNEVLNEIIWNNKHILVDNKPIFLKTWYEGGIRTVKDIVNEDGQFISVNGLQLKYGIIINCMHLNSIKTAIPKQWLNKINSVRMDNFQEIDSLNIIIGKSYKNISSLKCKDFYRELILRKSQGIRAKALESWEEQFFHTDFDWKIIFRLPYKVARETDLQSFQYQVLNRYIGCKNNLFKWGKEQNGNCPVCNKIDTIEHLLFTCIDANKFWNEFNTWWFESMNFTIKLSIVDIIFGIQNTMNDKFIDVLNFCILFAKQYIYKCRYKDTKCNLTSFKNLLKERVEIERYIAIMTDTLVAFMQHWGRLCEL